jgi:hypothetical protein
MKCASYLHKAAVWFEICWFPEYGRSKNFRFFMDSLATEDERGSMVRFPAGDGNFSPRHRVWNGSEAHPASYPVGTKGSFPGGKATGA